MEFNIYCILHLKATELLLSQV